MNRKIIMNYWVKYREILIINLALLLFLLVMLWIKPLDALRKYTVYNHCEETEEIILPVYGDATVSQFFTCNNVADFFELRIFPVNDEYHGSFCVRLEDNEENIVEEWMPEKLDIVDGWMQFGLKKHIMEAGKGYRLYITAPESDEFGALGVAVSGPADVSDIGELIYDHPGDDVHDLPQGTVMCLGVYKRQINIFAVFAVICLFGAVNFCYFTKDKGTDKLALPILIASGLIMMFILAPGCGPDDIYHYYSSVALSNRIMLRSNIDEIEKKYESDLPIHNNTNSAITETYEGLRYRVNGEDGNFIYEGRRDKLTWPLSHLAQAIGITVGRLFKLGFIRVYTLGRLFNMAAYIALAVLAVRLIPVNKELMLMMAILPMSMQQATQLSYDAPMNGLALVFTGYLFKLLYEEGEISWKNIMIFSALLVAISPLKVIYIILAMLLLIIPAARFKSRSDRFIKLSVPVICSVISLYIARAGDVRRNVIRTADVTMSEDIQKVTNYSLRFVFQYPWRFVKLIISNSESHLSNMFKGMIGDSLAGFSISIPEYLVMMFGLCLLVCAVGEKRALFKNRWQTATVISVAILGYFAVLTVFSFAETTYGFTYIGGTQGRYLIPFLFPTMYCLCGRKINININRLSLFVPISFIELGYIFEVMSSIGF